MRYQPKHLAARPAGSPKKFRRTAAAVAVAATIGVGHEIRSATASAPPAPGSVAALGDAAHVGSATGQDIVGMARTPSGGGYWLASARGQVFNFGDAVALASSPERPLNQPVVDIAATPDGKGYWLAARDGGVFAYASATYLGSLEGPMNAPIVGMAATPSGQGYWLVARDGGVFAYGDATFVGSAGHLQLNEPIVGVASSPSGNGYWLVGRDGGIFAFGDAHFVGSTAAQELNEPIVGIAATPSGKGYWLAARDGGVFTFGDAAFHGSLAQQGGAPVTDIAGSPQGGQWLANGGKFLGHFDVTCYALRGTTASGHRVAPHVIAVDPRVIPLGTEIYVAGEGTRIALDTGGNIKGRRLDVWRRSVSECRAFGRKTLAVYLPRH